MTKQAQDNAGQNTDPNSEPGKLVVKCKPKDREGKIKTLFAKYWAEKWDKVSHDRMKANAAGTPQGSYGTYTLKFKVDSLGNIYPAGPAGPKVKGQQTYYWGTEGGTSHVIASNLGVDMQNALFDAQSHNMNDFAGDPGQPPITVTIGPRKMTNAPEDLYDNPDASQTGAELL
jgi:hypothetical protein